MKEARVFIGGVELSYSEVMTLRVALNAFALQLQDGGLGDDEHGRAMTEAYNQNLRGIMLLMFASSKKDGQSPPLRFNE